ncbi:MAG: hypothetical protein ACXQTJ_03850 [Candidatus Syntropharchaeales archaeon]
MVPRIKKLEGAGLVKRGVEDDEELGGRVEYVSLVNRGRRAIKKILEKALIEWSAETRVSEVKWGRSKIDTYIFRILERNNWDMHLRHLKSELSLFWAENTVRDHINNLSTERLIYRSFLHERVLVGKNAVEKVKPIIKERKKEIEDYIPQLLDKAIGKWSNNITDEILLVLQLINEEEKVKRLGILNFLQDQGFGEADSENILYDMGNLPLIDFEIGEDGTTYYSIPAYAFDILKGVLSKRKMKAKKPGRKRRETPHYLTPQQPSSLFSLQPSSNHRVSDEVGSYL